MKQKFSIGYKDMKIVGNVIRSSTNQNVLCIHGGGLASKSDFDKIRKILLDNNISSYAFDCIGHGESNGQIGMSSLESRLGQAMAVIKSQNLQSDPLSVIASSMGGYAAIRLVGLYDISNLILIAPAIYDKTAFGVAFGQKFSKIIRKQDSWLNTDAWEIVKNYTGNILIFAAENDQVIPSGVIEGIYNSAKKAKTRKVMLIKNANHPLIGWLNKHPKNLYSASSEIVNLVNNK